MPVAVLDVGKSNAKAVLFELAEGRELMVRTMPNTVRRDGPYPHFDTDRIWRFALDAFREMAERHAIDAVSITTHGASVALIGEDDLALPVLDYEHPLPDEIQDAYDRVRPPFSETRSPRLPGGLNVGAQLFWLARAFPERFAAARQIVTYPQYWAWRLSGVASSEASSLGAHTDLWAPEAGRFSSLVVNEGWTERFAPLRSPFDALGPLRADVAAALGAGGHVKVHCGIHDSNASLLPHLLQRPTPFSVVSTGTWTIVFAVGSTPPALVPDRDTLMNVDAFRRPVPSARFMGGREFDILTGGRAEAPGAADVAAVLRGGVMALPTFSPGNGPYPQGQGRWIGDPETLSAPERTAAASLYLALTAARCLELVGAAGPIVVEGPFARNAVFAEGLALLAGRPVEMSSGTTGTSLGAALLTSAGRTPSPRRETPPPNSGLVDGAALRSYAASWRARADEADRAG